MNPEVVRLESIALRVVLIAVALVAANPVIAEDSALTWIVSTEARYDDNIGFAPDDDSKRDDISTRVQGTVGWSPVQTATREVSLTGGIFYETVADLTDLSNGGVVGKLRLFQQFSPAFTSPWVSLESEVTRLSFDDSELRDGYKVDSELAFGKRLNEKFGISLGYRYQLRVSTKDEPEGTLVDPIFGDRNSDEVFDQDRQGGFVNFEWNPGPRTTFFAEYTFLTGDVAATANVLAFLNPEEFDSARDFAFEEGIDFLVWKIDADQNVYTVGATQSLSDLWQVELTADYLDATGEADNDYENYVVTLGLSVSF